VKILTTKAHENVLLAFCFSISIYVEKNIKNRYPAHFSIEQFLKISLIYFVPLLWVFEVHSTQMLWL
jgi:hypothetical protein